MAELHPDRLSPALPADTDRLADAVRSGSGPEAWVADVNPGFWDDVASGAAERTTNCAECARAFQSTLEGHPTCAAALAAEGLGAEGNPDRPGEHPCYTEQWAGRRAVPADPAKLGRSLERTDGSAIILATGPEGGHAFNAYVDGAAGRVRWADAQSGVVGDWPPSEYANRFPHWKAILFPPRRLG